MQRLLSFCWMGKRWAMKCSSRFDCVSANRSCSVSDQGCIVNRSCWDPQHAWQLFGLKNSQRGGPARYLIIFSWVLELSQNFLPK
jgi:hypothetical protein